MKKILIHTINDDNNFGNRLQNFALQHVLNLREDAVAVTHQYDELNYYGHINELRNALPGKLLIALLRTKSMPFKQAWMWRERSDVFRKFTKQYVPKNPTKQSNLEADLFVIGSDQIWNPEFRNDLESDFLPLVPSYKKLAYAASIGSNPFELNGSDYTIFENNAGNISNISMRETDAARFLSSITNKQVATVLDPTFLVDKKVWADLAEESAFKIRKPFILTYFLGELSNEKRNYIEKVAKLNSAEILEINNPDKDYFGKIGPLEFLYLFKNCIMAFTDSFHATVFSIINEKPFEVFSRVDSSIVKNMNSRLSTLLETFELNDAWKVSSFDEVSIQEIDYNRVNSILEDRVYYSKRWLDEAVSESLNR